MNDDNIVEFVESYVENKSKDIWKEIQDNEKIINLAYNPLMLKMILSVSKQGSIPKNRGLLYQLFIQTIFHREKTKKAQTRTDTKMDVLSDIAFKMRQGGTMKVPIPKFKDYISKKLSRINSTVSVNILYTELLDNLLIYETDSDEVSFFHESYQEYFCAVQLKDLYEIKNQLPISLYEPKWFNALVMCGEIIKNEERAALFFEYIFRGQKNSTGEKRLMDFGAEDFNVNINIACKIAYSLESIKPKIYELAKKSLNNYIVIWKYLYYSKHIEVIPLPDLFASVASLNSEDLFKKIIINFGWANIWLNSGSDKHPNSFFIGNAFSEYANDLSNLIAKSINQNLPELSTFYKIISLGHNHYFFSKSIQDELVKVKYKILANTPETQLKLYYKKNNDFSIFIQILKNDIQFIDKYSFNNHDEVDNKLVFRTILTNHVKSDKAHQIFISQWPLLVEYSLINGVIMRLYLNCQRTTLFNLFEILFEERKQIFTDNVHVLQAIPFNKLSVKIKSTFSKLRVQEKINYSSLEKQRGFKYSCIIPYDSINQIRSDCYYKIGKKVSGKISNIQKILESSKLSFLICADVEISELPQKGVVENRHFKIQYVSCKLTSKGDKIYFVTPISGKKGVNSFDINNGDLIEINGKFKGEFLNWDREWKENKKYCKAQFNLEHPKKQNRELPSKGEFRQIAPTINVNNKKSIHPGFIENNEKLVGIIKNHIHEKPYADYVRKLGISYLFHKEISHINYAIVVNIFKTRVKLFSIKAKKLLEIELCDLDSSLFSLEKIVIIESNNRINLVKEAEEKLDKIGFIYSEIVNIDLQREEGFIIMKDRKYSSDYFFHFRSCDFIPKVGDYVKFIPALNPSRNYYGKPIALKVTRVKMPKCIILFANYVESEENIWGKAVDQLTEEQLYFRLNFENEKYITNLKGQIKKGDNFEYITIKEKKDRLLKLIKLVRFTEN